VSVFCRELTKSFDGVTALRDVSLKLSDQGIVALIGPNGAGKTTFLNVITGFEKPDSGSTEIDGTSIASLRPFEIARLGVSRTFQQVRLFWDMSIIDNVICARQGEPVEGPIRSLAKLGVRAEDRRNRRDAERALASVKLDGLANVMPQNLSYGQQKLLSIVCAVETEARTLIFDEPVSGVDARMRDEVLQVLDQLKNYRRLILFIEHDMEAVRAIADEVVVMDQGSIIAFGAPEEVLSHSEVIAAFWGK